MSPCGGGMEPLDGSRGGGPQAPGPQRGPGSMGAPGSPKGGGGSGGMGQVGMAGQPQFGVPCGGPGMTFYALPYFVMTPNGAGSGPAGFPGSPTGGPGLPGDPVRMGGPPIIPGVVPGALGPMPGMPPPMTPADHMALKTQVQKQIEHYFGQDNLLKDMYLRSKMNEEGWVPIAEIAGFPRVRNMTTDMTIILEAVTASTVIEIHSDSTHIRLREGWQPWPLPNSPGGSPQG